MPSINSRSATRLIKDFSFEVLSAATLDYVYVNVANFNFTKFFIEVQNKTTGEAQVFTAHVAKLSTNDPEDNIFGKVGDNLNFKFNVLKIGTDIVIRVENNEANTIKVSIIRITI